MEACTHLKLATCDVRKIPTSLMQPQKETVLLQLLNQIILTVANPKASLQQVAQAMAESFQLDKCLITVKCDSNPAQIYWDSSQEPIELFQPQILALRNLTSALHFDNGILAIDDIQVIEDNRATEWKHLLRSTVGAVLGVPLWFGGGICGEMLLIRTKPYNWTDTEKAVALAVAPQVAIAVAQFAQATLIANLQAQLQTSQQCRAATNHLTIAKRNPMLPQVETLVEGTVELHSLEIQALYEKTRQQIDQLRQLNQLKDEFLSNINHELRTPLTCMSLAIRLLRQPGIGTELQTKYLDILEQQCTQEIKLVNDLLRLQELQSNQNPLQVETINLNLKIWDLVQSFEEKRKKLGLTIEINLPKAPLMLQTEADSFDRILQELLTNACKYSNPDTTIVLTANQRAGAIVLSLTNISSNIFPEEITQIFDRFHRGRGVTQKAIQGTGLGLALVKCLVQHLSGTIDVSSYPDSHSTTSEICFTLTLPKLFELQL